MNDRESEAHDTDDLNQLIDELRQSGENPDPGLFERLRAFGNAAVRSLIEMAVDDDLYDADSDSPEVWAPGHAIQLLGDLGAAEAIEPLLRLCDRVEDDWLATALPDAFGGIGAPALAPLRALLFDRHHDLYARVRAADGLSQIGQRQPELRSAAISALVARLDPAESQEPEDETLNALVICALLNMKAVEEMPAIRRAFEEDRVDTSIVGLDWAMEELGLSTEARPRRSEKGLRLRLLCTACHYEREHLVKLVYYDLSTADRRKRGEETPYREFIIPRRITCPKCGAVDQYQMTGMATLALMAETFKLAAKAQGIALPESLGSEAEADDDPGPLVYTRFTVADGREMHPLAARDMYREQVAAAPESADLRVRYANVLRFLGYLDEAIAEYQAALSADPANVEAYLNLGVFAQNASDVEEARRMFEQVLSLAPNSSLSGDLKDKYRHAAQEGLAGRPVALGFEYIAATPFPQPAAPQERGVPAIGQFATTTGQPIRRAAPKVGRNEPCPCGSGKKYKKCHGR